MLILAYHSFGRFKQAHTHLDTPPFSLSHHPFPGIALITAKLNNVDPRAWLADVLRRIADHPASRLHELLPWNWGQQAAKLAA